MLMIRPVAIAVALASSFMMMPTVTCAADSNESCMIAPAPAKVVTSRFGIYRGESSVAALNGAKKPHTHDGLDFRTGASGVPLYATSAGKVSFVGPRGTAGNTVIITRPSGDTIAYYHLSGFAPGIRVGVSVGAGQVIGISGNTNAGNATRGKFAKHLHFVYARPTPNNLRVASFSENAGRGPFNPATVPNSITTPRQAGIGWKTDPAPFFCETFRIDDQNPQRIPVLGGDTKRQHEILFGNVPPGGAKPDVQFDDTQVAAANAEALIAASEGRSVSESLSDSDGYGALPSAPIGDYETMSVSEMMLTESNRRLMDAEWNTKITEVSTRALYIDYVKANAVALYLDEAIYRKKERIEALLAVYAAQKTRPLQAQVRRAQEQADTATFSRMIR